MTLNVPKAMTCTFEQNEIEVVEVQVLLSNYDSCVKSCECFEMHDSELVFQHKI